MGTGIIYTQGLKMTDLENTAFAPCSRVWFISMKMAIKIILYLAEGCKNGVNDYYKVLSLIH